MRRAIALLALASCSADEVPEVRPERAPERAVEPVIVRAGGRDVAVRCASSGCALVESELAELQRGCATSPTSTPRQLSTSAAFVAVACCTEARATYERACGADGLEACLDRWAARCADAAR